MSNNNGVELKSGKGIGPEDSPVDFEFKHSLICLNCDQIIKCSVEIFYCPNCGYEINE